ncbi:hypothetical protein GCM10022244_14160 [Streptomyces gulbargensis]|uniref:Uncharacterized protein n=1 Tax=Streptomyces gulbargensis TaxID=364901 RepID=A0ABP7LTR3_9ACTN
MSPLLVAGAAAGGEAPALDTGLPFLYSSGRALVLAARTGAPFPPEDEKE